MVKVWQRLYDYKKGFKVKVISIVESPILWVSYLVKPYKIVEDRSYVFKNTYIIKDFIIL